MRYKKKFSGAGIGFAMIKVQAVLFCPRSSAEAGGEEYEMISFRFMVAQEQNNVKFTQKLTHFSGSDDKHVRLAWTHNI